MALDPQERSMLQPLDDAQGPMEALLADLVDTNSHSDNAAGANLVVDRVEEALEGLGFRTSVLVTGVRGRTLIARREAEGSHRLLLLGHVDTVHPPEGAFQKYARDPGQGDRATGPGAADMKGGLVVMIEALRTLHAAGSLDGRHLTVVINADEEVGSPESGDLIRSEAAESQLCLCFEAGRPTGDGGGGTFVTRRRGFGRLTLVAKGRAAHAGVAPERGASALLELCHKAIDLSALSDPGAGIHVTVGILRGGTAANTVPAAASLELDYRFPDEDAQVELEDRIFAIAARNIVRDADGRAAVATTLRDHIKRPALVRTDAIARMAQRIVASGRDLGLVLEEEGRGGSSDAALAAEVGCPAVCGLGVVGDAFHTEQEWIRPSSLVERARLAALTIARFYAL